MLVATTPVAAGDMKDAEAAVFRLWKPLADQGDMHSQALIGMMYYRVAGVPKDYAKAVFSSTKAVKQEHAPAQYHLGAMCAQGKGVPEDYAKGAHWFTKAAKQGHVKAQYYRGAIYYQGTGVPEDYVLAYAWVNIAAAQGRADGKKAKAIIAKRMTPTQIAEAQKLSREIWEKYVVLFQKK